jgi:hypothetical protein
MNRFFLLFLFLAIPGVAWSQTVDFQLEVTDSQGIALSSVQVGQTFYLQGYVQDTRTPPRGILSFYADVLYDSLLLSPDANSFSLGSEFVNAQIHSSLVVNGVLDEMGGLVKTASTIPPVPNGIGVAPTLLFSVNFRAEREGFVTFRTDPADILPRRATTVLGNDNGISASDIRFGSASISILVPEPATISIVTMAWIVIFLQRRKPITK